MSENEWRRARSSTTRYKMKENVQTSMNIETLETHSMRSSPIRYSVSQRVCTKGDQLLAACPAMCMCSVHGISGVRVKLGFSCSGCQVQSVQHTQDKNAALTMQTGFESNQNAPCNANTILVACASS